MNSCCFNSWKLFKKVEVIVSLISYQINTMLIKLVIRNHMILENSYYGMLQESWISSRCCWDRHQWAHKFISSSVRWRPLCPKLKAELGLKQLSLYCWPCLSLHSTTQHPAKDPINTNTGCSFFLECSRAASQSNIWSSCGLLGAQDLGHMECNSRTT